MTPMQTQVQHYHYASAPNANEPLTVTLCSPVPGCVNRSTWIDASPTGSSPGAGFSDIDTATEQYSLSTLHKHVTDVTNLQVSVPHLTISIKRKVKVPILASSVRGQS